jgi:hypothetical protein
MVCGVVLVGRERVTRTPSARGAADVPLGGAHTSTMSNGIGAVPMAACVGSLVGAVCAMVASAVTQAVRKSKAVRA